MLQQQRCQRPRMELKVHRKNVRSRETHGAVEHLFAGPVSLVDEGVYHGKLLGDL